jgi:predicted acetylornithine/succinylornithine family transaminase
VSSRVGPGGGSTGAVDLRERVLATYARYDVTFVEGEGCTLVTDDGRELLDFAAGIAVVALGHRHPAPTAAAHAQLDRLWHASNLYWTEPMLELAVKLSDRFGGSRAFFCNSGAEAIESAVKYARRATGRPGLVALEGSFHGRTMGALSVTGQPAKQAGFGPLVPGVTFARPNDVESLEAAVSPGGDTGLILLETVLGEGGVLPLEAPFLQAAAEIAREVGALLCLDEIQCGVGRTGTFFAYEQAEVSPQLVTLAKGLANGLPIGALLVADEIEGGLEPGTHASTFGGNPVSCAAACAVCDALTDELLEGVRALGGRLAEGLAALPGVVEVRGLGLMLAAELDRPAGPVVAAALDAGLLVTSAGERTLRLTPPLVVSKDEVDRGIEILLEVLAG